MTRDIHVHRAQPRTIGFPGYPGYPGLPAAAQVCYTIADGCAECLEKALDEADGDIHVCSALVAYTAEVLATSHPGRALPAELGSQSTRPGAPVPGPDFVAAARAAFESSPASCAGNGVPAAQRVLARLRRPELRNALDDAVGLLSVYQPRTETGRNALKALPIHL